MHPYFPHLLSDFAAACRDEIPEEEVRPQTIEEHFDEIDRPIEGEESQYTFEDYFGFNAENFPPEEQLTNDEIISIRKAFEQMMYTGKPGIDAPETLPVAFAYKITVDSLYLKTHIGNSGCRTFNFCSGSHFQDFSTQAWLILKIVESSFTD